MKPIPSLPVLFHVPSRLWTLERSPTGYWSPRIIPTSAWTWGHRLLVAGLLTLCLYLAGCAHLPQGQSDPVRPSIVQRVWSYVPAGLRMLADLIEQRQADGTEQGEP